MTNADVILNELQSLVNSTIVDVEIRNTRFDKVSRVIITLSNDQTVTFSSQG